MTIKFVTDAASRVAEIESGNAHVTLEIPYEEYDRLRNGSNISGTAAPISDIGMIFLNDVDVMLDRNVRLAAHHAIDKKLLVERLLNGYGVPIDTLQTPDYIAYDPSIEVPYDPSKAAELLAASGYGPDNPVRFKIQTTRGFKPKDYEMIQAIVGLWRRVGIEAEIDVYEIAKHYELRAADQLAPAAFYNWGNAVGRSHDIDRLRDVRPEPAFGLGRRGSNWNDRTAMGRGRRRQAHRRLEGGVDRKIAEDGLVIPLIQYVQPILHSNEVSVTPHASGALLPFLMSRA